MRQFALSSQAHKKSIVAHGAVLGQVLLVKVHQELFGLESKLLVHDLVNCFRQRYVSHVDSILLRVTCLCPHFFFSVNIEIAHSPWRDY